jgi:SNF2 family DNA or RNA helicase
MLYIIFFLLIYLHQQLTDNAACHSSLDLTAATRIHLLEPQWNPAVEEQAMARVHRMGQHREVVTVRYLVNNSIEEVSWRKTRKKHLMVMKKVH